MMTWSVVIFKRHLEQGNLQQGNIKYKLIEKQKVYIMYNHALYLELLVSPDLKLLMEDYQ